jgi:hypothetical protein
VPRDSDVGSPLTIKKRSRLGGDYADDAPVLCGNWLCGGPLDFPAASFASR